MQSLASLTRARHYASTTRLIGRRFTTSGAQSIEWLVILPDHPDVLDRRLLVRPKHSPCFQRLHQEGYVSWAGPVFRRHVAAGEKRPFKGSVMVLNDTTKENILKKLATDVYVTENIWDLEKAQIIPFQTVLRLGHEHASQQAE